MAHWHLHGTGLLVGTALCGHLEAVGPPPARGPVIGSQFLHEVFQTDDPMEGRQGLQSKELPVGNMDLEVQQPVHGENCSGSALINTPRVAACVLIGQFDETWSHNNVAQKTYDSSIFHTAGHLLCRCQIRVHTVYTCSSKLTH